MTTTYAPFIPADGTDQRRYDGRRRAEERDGGSAWDAEPRREPQYQEPQYEEPQYEEPQYQEQRYQQPQFQQFQQPQQYSEPRWEAEPAAQPRTWQTGGFPVPSEVAEPDRARSGGSRGMVKPLVAGLVAV